MDPMLTIKIKTCMCIRKIHQSNNPKYTCNNADQYKTRSGWTNRWATISNISSQLFMM